MLVNIGNLILVDIGKSYKKVGKRDTRGYLQGKES